MRRGAIINKKRVIDTCIAKGNDTRVDMTDPLNPVYPMFRYINAGTTNNTTGELLLRNSIIKDNILLNTLNQLIPSIESFSDYIGDNKQRNYYPSGILELHQRVHKTQVKKIEILNFRWVSNLVGSSYIINYLNIKKTNNVKYITAYNVDTLAVATTYLNLVAVNIDSNLIGFPNIIAPKLDILNLSNNLALGNINVNTYLQLSDLRLSNCNITVLNVSSNTVIKVLLIGNFIFNNNNNIGSNLIGLSNLTLLETLDVSQCSLSALDVSNNTNLISLTCMLNVDITITGLYNLVMLQYLNITKGVTIINNFNLDIFPDLISCILNSNYNISGDIVTTSPKPNLTTLQIRETSITWFNTEDTPNLTTLVINNGLGLNQIDFTKLTKLMLLNAFNTTTGNCYIIDLRNGTLNMTTLSLYQNQVITHLYLPPTQVANLVNIHSCNNLSTFVINNISRTNTSLFINNLALATLDTSFGATNCFPNLTELAVGGTNDTYTSTKVFDGRKNNLITLVVLGTHFQVNGNIGTDTCAAATFININGDSNLSYTGSGSFGATMRRVFLRPKTGSGLATDGNQVANLIIALSLKTWSASGNTSINNANYAHRVIDLRGNCAVATPSTALTTALNLLTTKGVSVLRN